ncbi:MAG: bacillithiol transferase BstA [Acidobacteriaceae bacterium]|nr:bacillithiol transferase BstA [Acidobacteriaceae bacterium]MBV9498373.1 bacillithiol transferase BstA [Acidobacteriaceae bacterium]
MGTTSAENVRDLRYPIGRFEPPQTVTRKQRDAWIGDLERFPADLTRAVRDLNDAQLDTAYRPGGWTVRQLVHHLPDSHLNAYVRFRLALTEITPVIKPYDEAAWARLPDANTAPIEPSLKLLESLHIRLTLLLRSMQDADFARSFQHPELGDVRLDRNLALYSWHGLHHLAHITGLKEREGW